MLAEYFRVDNLSLVTAIFIAFFSVLVAFYSLGYMKRKKNIFLYYTCLLCTAVASVGAVFANNLVVFMVFWGFLGFLLYLLIEFGGTEKSSYTAKKAFIIIGGTDAFMLFGVACIWHLAGSMDIDKISLAFDNKVAIFAYLCLLSGALAKAGAMPFHTWVPDTAEDAPTTVAAFLPASLDKLLGIYFIARMSLDMFKMDLGMNTVLMVIGSVTIVAAVMMALIQHDLKRLLGYHAVSQVGYMVLGIGTGNPIGIAGGIFHMINHTIYKSCLFLSGGAVEKEAGTTNLDKLGGLAKAMPISFVTFLVASLAISGVPPFNGFVSKWMVYQGVIETSFTGGKLWIIWLVAAMFGSALTLASFMKLLHAVFLGQRSKELKKDVHETGPTMWIPTVILALLCVIFGVFAYRIPLKLFVLPSVNVSVLFMGIWNSSLATSLLLIGVVIGFVIYLLGLATKSRTTEIFVGGETLKKYPAMRISGTEFYNTIQDIGVLKFIYTLAKNKLFDIYNVGVNLTLAFNRLLKYLHNGVLSTYLAWCLLGMIVLFWILVK